MARPLFRGRHESLAAYYVRRAWIHSAPIIAALSMAAIVGFLLYRDLGN